MGTERIVLLLQLRERKQSVLVVWVAGGLEDGRQAALV